MLPSFFVAAIIAAVIAFNRNRSPFGWFILGLIIGWIAVLIVAVIPKGNGETEE